MKDAEIEFKSSGNTGRKIKETMSLSPWALIMWNQAHGLNNWKVIIGGSSVGVVHRMSCAGMLTWTKAFTVLNIGFLTGGMERS